MRIDHAPMEGITNYLYRQAFAHCFGGVDRFYTPFLSPNQNHRFTRREWDEIDPAHNEGMDVVPQLLANDPANFLWACGELKALGYREVNLNAGCPSGTVTAKRKGSGMLADPAALDAFLGTVCAGLDGMRLSVKTRIGIRDEAEFAALLDVYARYPLAELIVHPRLQKDFYARPVRAKVFATAISACPFPLGYNGDLFSAEDVHALAARCPELNSVMLARGIVANPALAMETKGTGARNKAALAEFHAQLYENCAARLPGDCALLNHMKEWWYYVLPLFTNAAQYEKPLRKAERRAEYEALTHRLFQTEALLPSAHFTPAYPPSL